MTISTAILFLESLLLLAVVVAAGIRRMFAMPIEERVVELLRVGDASGARIACVTGCVNIYPILFRLEQKGLILSWWEDQNGAYPRRRVYGLTPKGHGA